MNEGDDKKTPSQRSYEEWREYLAEGLRQAKRNGTMRRYPPGQKPRARLIETMRTQWLADIDRDRGHEYDPVPLVIWSGMWPECLP